MTHLQDKSISKPNGGLAYANGSEGTPGILRLPLEIRQQIYSLLFHGTSPNLGTRCPRNFSCHCGSGLSHANHLFYNEARPLFYKCQPFRFKDPSTCIRLFTSIGNDFVDQITWLWITYTWSDSHLLHDIFGRFSENSNLQTLRLATGQTPFPEKSALLYSTYASPSPAAIYDLTLRKRTHPLANLRGLRDFKMMGYPLPEVEEAVFKVTMNMELLAQREGNLLKRKQEPSPLEFHAYRFTIESEHEVSKNQRANK